MKLATLKKTVGANLRANKASYLIGAGLVTGAVALVATAKQSLKLHDIIEEHKTEIEKREESLNSGAMFATEEGEKPYDEKAFKQDKRNVTLRTFVKCCKIYAIPATLAALSMALILAGNKTHKKNTAAAIATGNAVLSTYMEAKKRAADVLGEEKANEIFNDIKHTGEKTNDIQMTEDKREKSVNERLVAGKNGRWTFIFNSESSDMWANYHMANVQLFTSVENDLNNMLNIEGAVLVNDVLRKLGLCKTESGTRDGWIRKDLGGEDGSIFITTTLLDANKLEYLIELNIDGDISPNYEKALRTARRPVVRKDW